MMANFYALLYRIYLVLKKLLPEEGTENDTRVPSW